MNKLTNLVNNAADFVTENKEEIYTVALVVLNVALCARSYKMGKAGIKLSFGNKLITNQFFYQMGRK